MPSAVPIFQKMSDEKQVITLHNLIWILQYVFMARVSKKIPY